MSEQTRTIISKVWGMCGPLRDDGVSYGDYLVQLTYLIFLKMSDEYAKPPYKRQTGIPKGCGWAAPWAKSSRVLPTRSTTPPSCTASSR
jgi:type I restriction enzyme M protein